MKSLEQTTIQAVRSIAQRSQILLTTTQAAFHLGVQPSTLATWRCTNRYPLPYTKIGSRVFYKQSDLDAFIEHNTVVGGGNV